MTIGDKQKQKAERLYEDRQRGNNCIDQHDDEIQNLHTRQFIQG